ncbi:hypothetical protein GLYMA_17G114200v4 [Glycine max]|uniref:Uncharacterized protein n=1 Tax=Glycine max TaxID=3847 RepID=A0A0R0FB37_SOYBN|nr:hypothetical protein JHK86_047119 [Glycine max]KAG4943046.1 hypothetical protein JHK85_047692 [Glycine max]KAG5102158.1 hypothetical protein JHK84_047127 [Glycine max]KAH1117992.1 hypothetical protein GYH30_046974 [Glycine max]KRH03693.1 hypothetical protein GLYMA_17G114200v4 [Glycine max]
MQTWWYHSNFSCFSLVRMIRQTLLNMCLLDNRPLGILEHATTFTPTTPAKINYNDIRYKKKSRKIWGTHT